MAQFSHDYWKNHSFDYMDLCWQNNVSAFNKSSLVSLLSKGLSRVFASTTVQKYQFFGAQLSFSSVQSLSHVWLFATPWTIARQAPLSMGFSRQEYRSELPCAPPGDIPTHGWNSHLPNPRMELATLLHWQAHSLKRILKSRDLLCQQRSI